MIKPTRGRKIVDRGHTKKNPDELTDPKSEIFAVSAEVIRILCGLISLGSVE